MGTLIDVPAPLFHFFMSIVSAMGRGEPKNHRAVSKPLVSKPLTCFQFSRVAQFSQSVMGTMWLG